MTVHRCNWCSYEYDPAKGDPARRILPGTPFDAVSADWRCPDCRAPRADFTALDT